MRRLWPFFLVAIAAPAAADTHEVLYRVVPGDTVSCIVERYGVAEARLRADNTALRHGLEAGMELRIQATRRARDGSGSESLGRPMCGQLSGGVQVQAHPAYVVRNVERSWLTRTNRTRLVRAFDAVAREHRRAPRVRVHDASLPDGGPIDDHRSHQSGRDVDITYYQREGCDGDGCPLRVIAAANLDVRRQWTLLERWLSRDEATAIFIDYSLQEPLYREARRRGTSEANLAKWFQYPRGPRDEQGVIQHLANHADHLHVRFTCASDEPHCRD